MIRPPRSSTLFPYTPLSRSHEVRDLPRRVVVEPPGRERVQENLEEVLMNLDREAQRGEVDVQPLHLLRSEEHTSELQSRLHLVCRLLLEKKKNRTNRTTTQT